MNTASDIQLVECPRDAMQGWAHMIDTTRKISYLKTLLKVGFHTIDFGSFVSPKAIPQMADTAEVYAAIEKDIAQNRLLAIIANERGAENALQHDRIEYLGFPFSVSPTFQRRNTNATIEEALVRVKNIQQLCIEKGRTLVVYLSMGFGNPYGDDYSEELVLQWAKDFAGMGVQIISLADTVGVATPDQVYGVTQHLVQYLPDTTIGVHLHASPDSRYEKLTAAFEAGCRRFDGAMKGFGGCPMAKDELVGNMDMETMIRFFKTKGIDTGIDEAALEEASRMAMETFV